MKIAVSGLSMAYLSGQPLYCYELCMELKRQDHDVTMVSAWSGPITGTEGYKLKENLVKAGVKCISFGESLEEQDLIIASETESKRLTSTQPNTPVIVVVHSEYDCETPIENSPQIIAYVCIRYNILWHIVKEHGIPEDKCVVIYNGVDRQRFKRAFKKNKSYKTVVVPCTLDTMREKFLNEIISTASAKRHIKIFGFDCGAQLNKSEFVTVSPDKFNIEEEIQQADEVAGILLGRVNLEAWSCGVKSTVYDPNTLSHVTYDPPVDFDQKYNIKNVTKQILALAVNLDELTVVIPHHNRVDKLKALMDDLTRIKNLVIRRGGTFAQNNNAGFSVVNTEYVLFLNDDSRININLIRGMMSAIRNYDIVGCLMEEGCTGFNIVNGILEEINHTEVAVTYPSGACLMVKTKVFKELLFNEDFKNGCEDVDLYLRAEQKGYKIGICRDFKLPHKEGSSEGRYKYVEQNILLFNKIWKNKCQIKESILSGV